MGLGQRAKPRQAGQPLTGYVSRDPNSADPSNTPSLAFAPDGTTLAGADGHKEGTVRLWDLSDRRRSARSGTSLAGHSEPVTSVAFGPDGHKLLSADNGGTLLSSDLVDRTKPRRLDELHLAHTGDVASSVAFAPNAQTFATGHPDGTVTLWDLADRAQPHRLPDLPTKPSDDLNSLALAPDGQILATLSRDTATLWDMTNPTRPRRLGKPLKGGHYMNEVAFAPDGQTLATASDDGLQLWDLTDQAHPRRLGKPLSGPNSNFWSIAFAPDAATLAAGGQPVDTGDEEAVLLWDITDPARPRRLGNPLLTPADGVGYVAFALRKETLAVSGSQASNNGTVQLWDVTDKARPENLGQVRVVEPSDNVGSSSIGADTLGGEFRTFAWLMRSCNAVCSSSSSSMLMPSRWMMEAGTVPAR